MIIEDWRADYNANRPHTAHGELTHPSSLYSGPRPTNPKPRSDRATKRDPLNLSILKPIGAAIRNRVLPIVRWLDPSVDT